MEIHVALLVLAFCGFCGSLERNEESRLIHRLRKRQVSAEDLGPIPYIDREQYAPLPYQQNGAADSSSSGSGVEAEAAAAAAAAAAESAAGNIENDDARANRDYHSSGYGGYVDSGHGSSSVSSRISGRSSADSSDPSRGGRQPYYQYQPPIRSGHHQSSQSHGQAASHHNGQSSHEEYFVAGNSHPSSDLFGGGSSQDGGGIPSQSHVAGFTRYSFSQPVGSSSFSSPEGRGSRRDSSSRTYSFPFSQHRSQQSAHERAGGAGGAGGDGADRTPVGLIRQDGAGGRGGVGGDHQAAVIGDEEPVIQVFPSERPVLNPQASQYQEQLRQRELELQRRLQQRREHQAAIAAAEAAAAAAAAGGNGAPQRRPISSSPSSSTPSPSSSGQQHLRPIYTGSQPLGGSYGQPVYYGRQQQQHGQQHRLGGGYGVGGSGVQQPIYGGGGQGQPVFRGGRRRQQPYYYGNHGYSQGGVDPGNYDSECPNTGIRIQINGIPCNQAVDHYGSYLCYRHEYTSRECCLRCRGLKNPARVGCEYGDHSGRCQQLQPYDCYDLRNRQSCCQSCERMIIPGARSGCEYGDMTPNCDQVRQNPGLCYTPENRYLCCQTCATVRVTEDPECPWGDQNADLCQPFDQSSNIRINCYARPIKRICCQACRRLEEWIPLNQPGCEYGDRPVTFNTGSHRNLNCTSFMRYYGYDQCTLNQAVATNCCYTCHRYNQGYSQG